METEKFRVVIASRSNIGSFHSPYDFIGFDELLKHLEDEGISEWSLMYTSRVDDSESRYKGNLSRENFTMEHFNWLTEETKGNPRFLQIDRQIKPPAAPTIITPSKSILHDRLMPFEPEQVKKYFAPESADAQLLYFEKSVGKYRDFENKTGGYTVDNYREYRQAEKDERFFTTKYFVALFESKDKTDKLKKLLVKSFGEIPPFERGKETPASWNSLLDGVELMLGKDLPSPKQYKEHLSTSLHKRHFVPYVIEHGTKADKSYRSDLEGATQVDAFIWQKDGINILIEAKFLSDISCNVSYDAARNQIARNIDVMLDCDIEKSLFLLLTPKYFKDQPHTRLYGYKMNDYMANHLNLMADLCHRHDIEPYEWKRIVERIAWITWEDLDELGLNVPKMR